MIPEGVTHCAELDDVGVVVEDVVVEDVEVDDVEVDDVEVDDVEVVVDEVVVEDVVVDEVVVVDEASTVSVKVSVAVPAPFVAFRANLTVPVLWGEPTRIGTSSLLLIFSGEGKVGHWAQACPLHGPTML